MGVYFDLQLQIELNRVWVYDFGMYTYNYIIIFRLFKTKTDIVSNARNA